MKRVALSLSLALLAVVFFAPFVLAIPAPDSTPTLSNIKVNRNLFEPGDVLIYADYNLPYTSVPNVSADDSFIFRLLSGTTELGTITPFAYMDHGYNLGVFSFYF